MKEARVIGAGLSGLATAWYLAEAGVRVHVDDAGDRPGGLIQTRRVPEGLVESAARAFVWSPRAEALFAAAGVAPCEADKTSKRRYILRGGRPRRWPLTIVETAGLVARTGRAWIGRGLKPQGDESVAAWGRRVMGPAATSWLLAPALQGIYASPPDALAARAVFGPKRVRGGRLIAPRAGMGELMDRLHAALVAKGATFTFNARVDTIDPSVPTAICTNAPAAALLLAPHAPASADAARRIRMVSLVTATAFLEPRPDDLRGFGILFPRAAGIKALGAIFNADVFPGRSDRRSETWIYGDLSPAALAPDDAAAGRAIAADRAMLTGRDDRPIACYVTRQIEALPVYDAAVLRTGDALPALPPRIAVAGNFAGRLGVSSLLEGAADAAARLAA